MSYKLLYQSDSILRLADSASIPPNRDNADYQAYLAWLAAGNTPEPADEPTPGELAREDEIRQAPGIARAWFAAHPAAVAFVRLTPAEREAAIAGYNTAQLKTLLTYLTEAVVVLIKRELL